MRWQRFWLDLCTKQVVSARACANQCLPNSSSGIALFGMRTVQADSCLNSEQIDTLFISVGGQEGVGGGGGVILGRRPEILTCVPGKYLLEASCLAPYISFLYLLSLSPFPAPQSSPALTLAAWRTQS